MAGKAILALTLVVSTVAGAQTVAPPAADPQAMPTQIEAAPSPPPTVPPPAPRLSIRTLGDLDQIQGEALVADARLQLATAQAALAKVSGDADDTALGSGAPMVTGVFGPVGEPYAKFVYANGVETLGRPGDRLPGGYRVREVTVDRVVYVDDKGREQMARFGKAPPAQESAQGAGQQHNGVVTR